MKIKGVEHIGIAVSDIEDLARIFEDLLGLKLQGKEKITHSNVEVAFFPCGSTNLELVTPLSDQSPIRSFLEKRGNGIHHICLDVEGIEEWMDFLAENGIEMIDQTPRKGAHGKKVAFINPKSTFGILIELSETE
ncbi:MAG: methylmalonyl-CoA epimerase [bacterium]